MSEVAVPEHGPPSVPARPARFVLLTDLPAKVARPASPTMPQRVTWRLIAANNRSLGQAPGFFGTVAECLVDIERLVGSAGDSAGSVHFHGSSATGNSYWSWTITRSGVVLARSVPEYRRRVECERALDHFLTAIATAPALPAPDRVRRLGDRLMR